MEILKNFVVFEGIDGSGTTTQMEILHNFFEKSKSKMLLPPLFKTFEPTNGCIGKLIRSALRNEIEFKPETIAMLFAADRNEHVFGANGIAEQCGLGKLVVCDRYLLSSLVYQGLTCGEELPIMLNQGFPGPELLVFFDITPQAAQERLNSRTQKEIYETLDFQNKVSERYKALLPRLSGSGVRVEIMDASLPKTRLAEQVWAVIEKMPIFKR